MIQIGSLVRSFDFADAFTNDDGKEVIIGRDLTGDRACYVEGTVVAFRKKDGCDRYVIKVTRDVFGGEESDRRVGSEVLPPVNGTPTWTGRKMNNVELVSESR